MTPTFHSLTGTNPIIATYRLVASIHPVSHFVSNKQGCDVIFFLRHEPLPEALRKLNVDAPRAISNPEYDAASKYNYISADDGNLRVFRCSWKV
jgi:hypothetical protein